MNLTWYDFAFYGAFIVVLLTYALSVHTYFIGRVSSLFLFRNASVLYYILFSVLLGKMVYEGTLLRSAHFNVHMYYLMLYYGIVLIGVAALFNMQRPTHDIEVRPSRINIVPLLLILLLKALLFLIDPTPMQELFVHGFAAAHLKQVVWHQPGGGGLVMPIYTFLSPVMCIVFIVYFQRTRNLLFRLALLPLLFETSGFFFSKSGLIVPLIVLLIISGARLRTLGLAIVIGVFGVFAVRIGTENLVTADLARAIGERFVDETGYANPQLELYEAKHPPLGYATRYYIGFNSLFGIEPAVDASRLAYVNETGKDTGATTSGHAAVSLYAFWGPAFYVILPVLLVFIFYLDAIVVRRISTSYELTAYIFVAMKCVNYLTVDIQRLIDFATIFDLTFITAVVAVWFVGKLLQLRIFSAPISFFGTRTAPGTA